MVQGFCFSCKLCRFSQQNNSHFTMACVNGKDCHRHTETIFVYLSKTRDPVQSGHAQFSQVITQTRRLDKTSEVYSDQTDCMHGLVQVCMLQNDIYQIQSTLSLLGGQTYKATRITTMATTTISLQEDMYSLMHRLLKIFRISSFLMQILHA